MILRQRLQKGFALPMVIIVGTVLFIVVVMVLGNTSSIKVALDTQFYNALARDAAESGANFVASCVAKNGDISWNPATNVVVPASTSCAGTPKASVPACVSSGNNIVSIDNYCSTYVVSDVSSTNGGPPFEVTVVGRTDLRRLSDGYIYRSFSSTLKTKVGNSSQPKITGGAGWGSVAGHINVYTSVDNKLYGFGYNRNGQFTDSKSPNEATSPIKLGLPTGVNSVKRVETSGQGASYLCIIGDDNNAYCRGEGGGFGASWTKIGFKGTSGLVVYDLSLNGYGDDATCVLAGASVSTKQVYCSGQNDYGMLGGGTIDTFISPTQSVKFGLPGGLTAKSVSTKGDNVCVIASDDKLYCAGNSLSGQIAGTQNEDNITPLAYSIPSRGAMSRKAKDVILEPHSDTEMITVLATDGTLWSSGQLVDGSFGIGSTSGVTGTGSAKLWGNSGANNNGDNATGGTVKASAFSEKCIDNDNGTLSNGNKLQIWSCDYTTSAQRWFLLDNQDGSYAIWLPMKSGAGSNFCMDLDSGNTADGTKIQLWTCDNVSAQRWIPSADGTIRHASSNKCINLKGNSSGNGTTLELRTCNGSSYQMFSVDGRARPWQQAIATNDTYCGLRDDEYGGIWCAGKNQYGQLADGTCTNSSNPRRFSFPTGTPAGTKLDLSKFSTEWKYQIDSLLIIASDGQVYGAGRNMSGKLGNGTVGSSGNGYRQCSTTRFILPAGVSASDLSARDEVSSYVLGGNSRIYATGQNGSGQLGDGTLTDRPTPVESKIPPSQRYSY